MKKQEKAALIKETLDKLFPNPEVPLVHKDPYTLLIATLLSAQCTDERVNLVTPKLFAKADTPEAMCRLTVEEIGELIRSCGLSARKAKAIHSLSQILTERHGGKVPIGFAELEALPGVGHKTASCVMAHAFKIPAFPVDTHIHRLAVRWGLSRGRNVEEVERDLKQLFDEKEWTRLHLQIIFFGRVYCPARGHDKKSCPICSFCDEA